MVSYIIFLFSEWPIVLDLELEKCEAHVTQVLDCAGIWMDKWTAATES